MPSAYEESTKKVAELEAVDYSSVRADAKKLMEEIPPDTRNTTEVIAGDPIKGRSFWDRLTPEQRSRYA